jgi:hypothetical protein
MYKIWNHIRGQTCCPDSSSSSSSSCPPFVSSTTTSFHQEESNHSKKRTPILSRRQQQQRWLQKLQQTSLREIKMSNPNTTTTNYEPMPDPMESRDPKTYRRQQSSSMNLSDNANDEYMDEEEEVYIVKQAHGYCAILFSIAQTLVLIIMMIQCGMAPLNINPMIGPYPGRLAYIVLEIQNTFAFSFTHI